MLKSQLTIFLLSFSNCTSRAAPRIDIMPMICKEESFSSKRCTPITTTQTGSNTDNNDAFSELIYFIASNKNNIGSAVQIRPTPVMSIQVSRLVGTNNVLSRFAMMKNKTQFANDTIKLEVNGSKVDICLLLKTTYAA